MNSVEEIQQTVLADGQIQLGFPSDDEETDLYNYEMVSGEFFAQIKEPAFTINVNKVYVNTAAVRLLPKVDYVNRVNKCLMCRSDGRCSSKCCKQRFMGWRWNLWRYIPEGRSQGADTGLLCV